MLHSVITGTGSYLPQKVVTNSDLQQTLDTDDEWIVSRTGIRQRHIAAEGELTSDLAHKASLEALNDAGITADDINLIIVATSTPDLTIPATANILAGKLGCKNAASFDINVACSGFVYALAVADSMIKSGIAKNALVIGAESYSKVVDWSDRSTCILFGDGAGAVVLEGVAEAESDGRGILYANLFSDGTLANLLMTDGGVATNGQSGHLHMMGREVFRHATEKMADSLQKALSVTGIDISEIDWLVPHQANSRILDAISSRLGVPENKVIRTISNHANTSAASIPLALRQAVNEKKLKKGNIVALQALGAGLTWGAILLKW